LLRTENKQHWNEIKDKLVISDIYNFIEQLAQVAQTYEVPLLIDYCSKIKIDLDEFNLDDVKDALATFPTIINEIENLGKI